MIIRSLSSAIFALFVAVAPFSTASADILYQGHALDFGDAQTSSFGLRVNHDGTDILLDVNSLDYDITSNGTTVVIDASVPNFSNFVELLTDGLDQDISFGYKKDNAPSNVAVTKLESELFNNPLNPSASLNGIDFAGFDIQNITLFIAARFINLNAQSGLIVDVDFQINGTASPTTSVPEPASVMLLALGLATGLRKRFRA